MREMIKVVVMLVGAAALFLMRPPLGDVRRLVAGADRSAGARAS